MTIVEELRRDRESGAKRLESEYKAGLMTLARNFCVDESDAEELVNRTFAAVVEGIDDYLEQSAFFAWMCQILKNIHALDTRRKSHGDIIYPGQVPEIADEDAQEEIYRNLDASLVREAIKLLPQDQRETLLLHYFMDMPVAKIAKFLAIPTGTVNSRLHYARKALATKLGVKMHEMAGKPGGKAVLLALLLCGLTALGAGARLAAARLLSSPPVTVEQQADNSKASGQAETYGLQFSNSSNLPQSPSGVAGSHQRGAEGGADFSQGENMNISKSTRAAAMLAAATIATSAATAAETASKVKYWDSPSYKAYDADAYVQDGLVWHYDGIRNQGTSLPHSTDATTWVNLGSGGNAYDLARTERGNSYGSEGGWTDDGFVFRGKDVFDASGFSYTVPTDWTVQMLVSADANDQIASWNAYLFCGSWNNFALSLTKGDPDPKAKAICVNAQGKSGEGRPYLYTDNPPYTYVTANLNEDAKTLSVFDGTSAPASGSGVISLGEAALSTVSLTKFTLGGYVSNGSSTMSGMVKSFRYYDRTLSNDELAWNRVIDETRFFGRTAQIPVTNLVITSNNPQLRGNLPDGNYYIAADGQAADTFIFSAPASTNIHFRTYNLVRVLVSIWDGTNGDWGDPIEFAPGASGYDIAVNLGAKTKIELKWAQGGGLVIYGIDDYVQDGLVWHYDGIRNQGAELPHSYDATTWVNLGSGGSAYDLTRTERGNTYGSEGAWTDDGFVFRGKDVFDASGFSYTVPTDWTVQMLVDAVAGSQIPSWNAYLFCGSWNNFALSLTKNDPDPKAKAVCVNAQGFGGAGRPYLYSASESYTHVTANLNGTSKTLMVFDGANAPSSGNGVISLGEAALSTVSLTKFTLGGYVSNGDSTMSGMVKSFRYYDRTLTDEELAKNRAVDNFRYFGPSATNVVVVAGGGAQTEAEGVYQVDGSWTFTAQTVFADGEEKDVAGYYTEQLSDGLWTNKSWHDGTAYTYVVGSDPTTVRLTWGSSRPGFVIIMR